MKHHVKRQLRRLVTERPHQVVAGAAAALMLATGTGAALATADEAPAVAAEVRGDTLASRAQASPAEPTVPAGSATPAAEPGSSASTAAPSSAATTPAPSPKARKATAEPDVTRKPKPPAAKSLDYDHETQNTFYNCGPAAVRHALSAAGIARTQNELAVQLGTTQAGTNSAEDTTRVLNAVVKGGPYRTRTIPGGAATAEQMDRLQADVVKAITGGRGVVVNVAGTATDTDGGWHSFPGGHYVAVIGYSDEGRLVKIADSADPAAPSYWLTTIDLAHWAATRGYSA
ncbi:Peptidase_C39 like family protein [Micromonospora nigra]|uniref:Peptidase_C39 like family protein n=1 Tax=Micromonospora nigra TaxID=145857 RepID=A0A1C6SSN3_9ACTN|nr:C39 family peptidase [Micromonospora nigra]SCL32596.1 Peptidase_C39 like family protein [Micromonospora nigra]